MLLDVIVIDDCNGFLFVTPSEGENQRLDSKALEFFLFLEIMTEIQRSRVHLHLLCFIYLFTFLMSIFERRW